MEEAGWWLPLESHPKGNVVLPGPKLPLKTISKPAPNFTHHSGCQCCMTGSIAYLEKGNLQDIHRQVAFRRPSKPTWASCVYVFLSLFTPILVTFKAKKSPTDMQRTEMSAQAKHWHGCVPNAIPSHSFLPQMRDLKSFNPKSDKNCGLPRSELHIELDAKHFRGGQLCMQHSYETATTISGFSMSSMSVSFVLQLV